MIYIKVQGGLGNQLFQFAAAYSLAQIVNSEVGIIVSALDTEIANAKITPRKFELGNVIDSSYYKIVELAEIEHIIHPNKNIWYRLKNRLQTIERYYERNLTYSEDFLKTSKIAYIEGYFQSYKYSDGHLGEVRKSMSFPASFSSQTMNCHKKQIDLDSICLHVRRGDYIENKYASAVHGFCGIDYYRRALSHFEKLNLKKPHVFVFSDDHNWVLNNLSIDFPHTHVNWNDSDNSYQDLWLMLNCKHFIVANSSFSLWAANFANYPQKVVIAPKKWFNDEQKFSGDLTRPEWLLL